MSQLYQTLFVGMGMSILAVVAMPVAAQGVLIAPQAVVVDARTGTGELMLVNQSDDPAEIAVSTIYGYPVTDTAGQMTLQMFDTVPDTAPSAAEWIQVFPRRLRLAPHARQTLRILVTPPKKGLPDREFWARIVVAVRSKKIPVATNGATPNISAGLTLEVRSVLALFYRNGTVSTGVTMHDATSRVVGDSVVARAALERTGNAAFVGALNGTLRDANGTIVASTMIPLGVYYALSPRLALPIAGLPAGHYKLTLDAVSARPDVPARLLLHAPTVSTTLDVVKP